MNIYSLPIHFTVDEHGCLSFIYLYGIINKAINILMSISSCTHARICLGYISRMGHRICTRSALPENVKL